MIDPAKATKGRRMSKKTRKKSSRTPSGPAAKSAAKKSTVAGRAVAKASAGNAKKPTPASHASASKTLKASVPKKVAARGAATKAAPENLARKQPAPAAGAPLTEGSKAPDFTLPADAGQDVSLADYRGRKLVIFFYPRADTPGCTREAIDFTRLSSAFADADTAVLGLSADTLKAQEAFRDKYQLSVALASDEKHDALESYGVWGEKSMYGKTFFGILRTTVLIDRNGRIARIWRNVKVDGHADEVLAAAQAL
jgi:thioredoxin-dependent peroxiredoxin